MTSFIGLEKPILAFLELDPAVMPDGEVKVGMNPLEHGPDALVQQIALRLFAEILHDLTVLLGQFQVAW